MDTTSRPMEVILHEVLVEIFMGNEFTRRRTYRAYDVASSSIVAYPLQLIGD
jgi:hypothetical protein